MLHIGVYVVKRIAAMCIALIILFAGCASFGTKEVIIPPNIDTADGLAAALDRGDDFILYDVRTSEEYERGHIPGAINIPHDVIAKKVPRSNRNKVIVVYCQSGGRSNMAYETLIEKKFNYVFDFGGVGNWEGALITGSSPR